MKHRAFPDALVLIFAMIVLAQVLTYFIPAGMYEREVVATPLDAPQTFTLPEADEPDRAVEEQTVFLPEGTLTYTPGRRVKEGTYHTVEAESLPWHAFLTKIPKGLEAAAEIIFFVFIVGGVIAVIRRTGALDALIGTAIRRFGHSPALLSGGMITLFAIGSFTVGMAEEYMPFVPILVSMCLALGLDAIVALGIVYLGAGIGYGCAALNPFTVLIAKDIAGQDPNVFFWPRVALLVVMIGLSVHHLMQYARRIQADPSRSLVVDVDYSEGFDLPKDMELTTPRMVIVAALVGMVGLFVWGVAAFGWYLIELAALFLGLALVAALVGRLTPNAAAQAFTAGAAEMTGTALLIGFARTIEVVLTDAQVIDTVIHGIASVLQQTEALGSFSSVVSAWGMLFVQSVCNFLIPSGSGQAYVTMPLMAPLADLTGIGRETAVLAYQFGDGFTNMLVPTNALLMGMLVLGRIPYQQWVRFVLPFLGKAYLILLAVLAYAAVVSLQ